jgi:hypothetical protein
MLMLVRVQLEGVLKAAWQLFPPDNSNPESVFGRSSVTNPPSCV